MTTGFSTRLRYEVGGLLLLSPMLFASGFRPHQAILVRIGLLKFGDAFSGGVAQLGLDREGSNRLLPIEITNTSDHELDFFTDGNSWGDRTLTVDVTTSDGQIHRINCATSGYLKNAPEIVRLEPGQTWVRTLDYSQIPWHGIRQVLRGHTVKVRAEIKQDTPMKTDPNLWIGNVTSAEMTVPVR